MCNLGTGVEGTSLRGTFSGILSQSEGLSSLMDLEELLLGAVSEVPVGSEDHIDHSMS